MKQFFNIGKAVLHRAIGLQSNYITKQEKTTYVIDEAASGCSACRYKILANMIEPGTSQYQELLSKCDTCPSKVMCEQVIEKTVYVNEKNKYGYQPRLKLNAIKLLLVLNNLVESDGYIVNLDISLLANTLNCDKKTIKNNLETLKKYNYILYSYNKTTGFNIYISEIENYYKKAGAGGRGYLTMSTECLNELLGINSINSLRLAIRGLMEFDELNMKGFTGYQKTYSELRNGMPKYCKRGIIQDNLQKISLFDVQLEDKKVHLFIKQQFNAKEQKKLELDFLTEYLREFNLSFNKLIDDIAEGKNFDLNDIQDPKYATTPHVADFTIDKSKPIKMVLKDKELQNLASLITQFSLDEVMAALAKVYNTYYAVGNRTDIKSLGALVRTLIIESNKEEKISA